MSTEDFETHKSALAAHKLEKPKMLRKRSAYYWSEIMSQQYHFDRQNVEVEHLKTVTKDDLMAVYNVSRFNYSKCNAVRRNINYFTRIKTYPGHCLLG